MQKQIITAISNRDKAICYTIEKNESYFRFLFLLLKDFNLKIPDIYDGSGNLPDINQNDTYTFYGNKDIDIVEVFGKDRIFLIIETDLRDRLTKFMETNCEFQKK